MSRALTLGAVLALAGCVERALPIPLDAGMVDLRVDGATPPVCPSGRSLLADDVKADAAQAAVSGGSVFYVASTGALAYAKAGAGHFPIVSGDHLGVVRYGSGVVVARRCPTGGKCFELALLNEAMTLVPLTTLPHQPRRLFGGQRGVVALAAPIVPEVPFSQELTALDLQTAAPAVTRGQGLVWACAVGAERIYTAGPPLVINDWKLEPQPAPAWTSEFAVDGIAIEAATLFFLANQGSDFSRVWRLGSADARPAPETLVVLPSSLHDLVVTPEAWYAAHNGLGGDDRATVVRIDRHDGTVRTIFTGETLLDWFDVEDGCLYATTGRDGDGTSDRALWRVPR